MTGLVRIVKGKMVKPVKFAVVDAFTESEFKGNPAAVCLLEEEREDGWLQSLAAEFNISETAFLTRIDSDSAFTRFHLRWFTPLVEVELCGHATLAAAHFCFTSDLVNGSTIEFSTLSGILTAKKVLEGKAQTSLECQNVEAGQPYYIELDFPAIPSTDWNSNETTFLSEVLGEASIIDVRKTAGGDILVVLSSANEVTEYEPQIEKINKLPGSDRGLIITAVSPQGSGFDFFSRFFCPKFGINEDPVCGSAHCALALYWSKKLQKYDLRAYAASPRSGIVKLHFDEQNNRVKLQGKAVTVMEGSVVV